MSFPAIPFFQTMPTQLTPTWASQRGHRTKRARLSFVLSSSSFTIAPDWLGALGKARQSQRQNVYSDAATASLLASVDGATLNAHFGAGLLIAWAFAS